MSEIDGKVVVLATEKYGFTGDFPKWNISEIKTQYANAVKTDDFQALVSLVPIIQNHYALQMAQMEIDLSGVGDELRTNVKSLNSSFSALRLELDKLIKIVG